MFDTLKKLVEADSISGYEENIQDLMKKELKKYVDEVKVDRIGNVIAKKGKGSPVVMFAAHMDEIGLIVKYIDKEGFVFFDKIGGWDERILPTRKVVVHGSKGKVFGVIGAKPIHLQEKDERKSPMKIKDMFIDIGARSEAEVKKAGISVGDYITNHGTVEKLLGTKVTGHGFDNRIGCLTLIESAKRLKRFKGTTYFVGTVKEELGLIGVRGSAFSINPDVLLALDTGFAGDVPGITKAEV
jgi:endoglucanase